MLTLSQMDSVASQLCRSVQSIGCDAQYKWKYDDVLKLGIFNASPPEGEVGPRNIGTLEKRP